eukprot:s1223_g5.t1
MSHGTERLTNGGTQTDEKMYDATMVRGYLVMVPDLLMAVAGMMIDAVLMNILNILVNTVTMPVDILDMILDETLRERRIAASVLLGSTVTDNGLDVRGLMKNNAFMMEDRTSCSASSVDEFDATDEEERAEQDNRDVHDPPPWTMKQWQDWESAAGPGEDDDGTFMQLSMSEEGELHNLGVYDEGRRELRGLLRELATLEDLEEGPEGRPRDLAAGSAEHLKCAAPRVLAPAAAAAVLASRGFVRRRNSQRPTRRRAWFGKSNQEKFESYVEQCSSYTARDLACLKPRWRTLLIGSLWRNPAGLRELRG